MANDNGGEKKKEDYGRVYTAVAAGQSAADVLGELWACAGISLEHRAAAANHPGRRREVEGATPREETPLQAAHRLRRGDLVSCWPRPAPTAA
jgi:hypothetical protein